MQPGPRPARERSEPPVFIPSAVLYPQLSVSFSSCRPMQAAASGRPGPTARGWDRAPGPGFPPGTSRPPGPFVDSRPWRCGLPP